MSKRQDNPQKQTPSSRNATIIMAIGAVVIAALIGWALTRTVDPAHSASTETIAQTQPLPAGQTAAPSTTASTPTPPGTQTGTPPAGPPPGEDAVPRMTIAELKQKLARNEVTVIDVRDVNAYGVAHIPGSLHIPFARIEGEAPYLSKAKPIVTYCT